MSDSSAEVVIADTSVLINFLAVDRLDLLERHPARFLITDHVLGEIQDHYPDRFVRCQAALERGIIEVVRAEAFEELALFARFAGSGRLGRGECSAIAVAVNRRFILAIDDKRARKEALAADRQLRTLTTQDLVVSMIRSGLLSVAEADAIKTEWATRHRFRLKLGSFAELLHPK